MKGKKIILFAALILPILVFLFLKFFGKNEFAVKSLYSDELPVLAEGCAPVTKFPYLIPDSIMHQFDFKKDTLMLVGFGELSTEGVTQLRRVHVEFETDVFQQVWVGASDPKMERWKKCIFFLSEPFDLVLVNKKGVIRGQYTSNDREEIDRLLTELSIILKKY